MSRYTGPRVRTMRALGTELPGLSRKRTERRPFPPGQHGQARRKQSEYGLRLIEKQKLRMNYGLAVAASLATPHGILTPWLTVDAEAKKATVSDLPDPSSVPFPLNVQRVVEFYSQRT